jgi:hypothetical protein
MTTYVPRSPRRATKLKAMVDGAATHVRGRVRDMSTSGLFVEANGALPIGSPVAVVPLLGDLDGERLPAEVARISKDGIGLRFTGLDADHRQRLRALVLGDDARLVRRPSTTRLKLPAVPSHAPVVLLTDDPSAEIPLPTVVGQALHERDPVEEMAEQLVALGLKNASLEDEIGRLRRHIHALEAKLAVRRTLENELFSLYETLEELEKANDMLVETIRDLSSSG